MLHLFFVLWDEKAILCAKDSQLRYVMWKRVFSKASSRSKDVAFNKVGVGKFRDFCRSISVHVRKETIYVKSSMDLIPRQA